jgi:RNA polymerase sigma-70 factor (ECF subfamily)
VDAHASDEERPVEDEPGPRGEPGRDEPADGDHALIPRAQAGEEDAFAALVRRYQSRAWRVARNMVASDEDAQDLAQEAFLRVFKSLERFDFNHEFPTWLYRIVTNLAIDHRRKRRPVQSTAGADDDDGELELVDPAQEAPSAAVEREETIDAVRDCLASLAPHFQSVLVLRELEGLACNEIAEIVGATHVTVRWRLHRGRKLFQEEWERRARLAERGTAGLESPFGAPSDASTPPRNGDGEAAANNRPERP